MKKPAGPKPNIKATLEIVENEIRAGNFKRAENITAHLRSCYPRRAEVNHKLGTILALQSERNVAYHYHQLAVTAEPRNIEYLESAGEDLLKMGRIVEADAIYRRILEINPRAFWALLALARFYEGIGLGDKALEYFDKALQQAPEMEKPGINLERMSCLIGLGRVEECEKEFEKGLEAGAHYAQFVALYAQLDRWNVTSQAYTLVVDELRKPNVSQATRARFTLLKAKLEQNSGFFDQAYDTMVQAKRLNGLTFEIAKFRNRVDEAVAGMPPEFLERCRMSMGHPSDNQVFVVGMPRSGTTLTEQIIASHSQAGGVGELETMSYLAHQLYNKRAIRELPEAVAELGPEKIRALAQEYVDVTEFLAPGKRVVVDKMPHNFVRLGEISLLLPNARFVHCVRDPADTFISAFENDMNASHAYSYDRDTYADYYALYRELMQHWYKAVPGRIFTLEYEKLVTTPEPVIRALLDFLGLPFEEACLNPQDRGALVKTFSRLQVRSSISPRSVGRWKKFQKQLQPLADRFAAPHPFPPTS